MSVICLLSFNLCTSLPIKIYNFNNHAECELEMMEKWLKFLSEKDPEGKKRKTQSWIMQNVIISEKRYVDLGEVINLDEKRYFTFDELLDKEDENIMECSQLITCNPASYVVSESPTDIFNFGRCLMTGTYCFLDEGCAKVSGGQSRGAPNYIPTKCTIRDISNLNGFKPVSELCPESVSSICIGETTEKLVGCGDGVCSEKEGIKRTCPEDCS